MSRNVRVIGIEPAAMIDAGAAIGEAIGRKVEEEGAFFVILIGDMESRQRFAEMNLWHFAPEEAVKAP